MSQRNMLGAQPRPPSRWSMPSRIPLDWRPFTLTSRASPGPTQPVVITPRSLHTTSQRPENSIVDPNVSLEKKGLGRLDSGLSGYSTEVASCADEDELQPRAWRPSFYRIGPLLGLAALLLAFSTIFFELAVLKISNGRPVADWQTHWQFKPSVYIAVLTLILNGAIEFALAQGATISWWLRALDGTTPVDLHRDWSYGSEFYNAIRAGKHVSKIAVACVAATLVNIDGPLLQRASSTELTVPNRPVDLSVAIVPEIPAYFTGPYRYNQTWAQADYSPDILPVVKEYASGTPITGAVHGCDGTCFATVRGPALVATHCSSNITWKNYSAPYTAKENEIYDKVGIPGTRILFGSNIASLQGAAETLDFSTYITGDKVAETCAGPVYNTHCYLKSAIAEYDIRVTNGSVKLLDAANPTFIAWANNTALTEETISKFHLRDADNPNIINTTLGGIVDAFITEFEYNEGAKKPRTPGRIDISFLSSSFFMLKHITNYEQYTTGKACSYAWKDPRPAAMAGMNELMFRIGVYAANKYSDEHLKPLLDSGVETRQNVVGAFETPYEVFHTEFPFYIAAALIQFIAILLVGRTYWGYWRLGRDVSLSPLETAKALYHIWLSGSPSGTRGKDIAMEMRLQRVRYGVLYARAETRSGDQKGETLAIAPEDTVTLPNGELRNLQESLHELRLWMAEHWSPAKARLVRWKRRAAMHSTEIA